MFAQAFSDDMVFLREASSDTLASSLSRKDGFGYFRPLKTLFFYLWLQVYPESVAYDPELCWQYHIYGSGAYYLSVICLGLFVWKATPLLDPVYRGSRLLWFSLLTCFFWGFAACNMLTAHWVSAFNLPLCGVALMAASFFQMGSFQHHTRFLLVFFSAFTGLMLYDTAIAVIPLFVGLKWLQGGSWRDWKFLSGFLGMLLAVVFFFLLRGMVGAHVMPGVPAFYNKDFLRVEVFLCAPWFVFTAFRMWFYPWGSMQVYSSFHYGETVSWPGVLCSWIWLGAFLFLIFRYGRRFPVAGFGAIWFFAVSSPCSNFIPIYAIQTDYYAILPGIGLSIMAADLVVRSLSQLSRLKAGWLVSAKVPLVVGLALVFVGMRIAVVSEYVLLCRLFRTTTDYLSYIRGNYAGHERLDWVLAHKEMWVNNWGYAFYYADCIGPNGLNPSIYSEVHAKFLVRAGRLDDAVVLVEKARMLICPRRDVNMQLFELDLLMRAYSDPKSRHFSLKKADIIGGLAKNLPNGKEKPAILRRWNWVRVRLGLPLVPEVG
jgi:hypothetical protein